MTTYDQLQGTRYQTVRALARGGMTDLVLARDTTLGLDVVVKILHVTGAEDIEKDDLDRARDRLRVEARALAMFDGHPNIVAVKDLGRTAGGTPYLVLEHLAGRSLGQEWRARRALPAAEAVQIVLALLVILDAVHGKGVVHRDVKPDNVFLCDGVHAGRTVKLIDFGVAKLVSEPTIEHIAPVYRTKKGSIVGTPRWLAPEQILGWPIDPRTDVYAAALVLYALVAGRTPFADCATIVEQAATMKKEGALPPSRWATQPIPEALDRVLLAALRFQPADRFQTAMELAHALEELLPLCDALPEEERTNVVVNRAAGPARADLVEVDLSVASFDAIPEAPAPREERTALERTLPLAAAVPRRTLVLITLGTTAVMLGLFLAAARALGAP